MPRNNQSIAGYHLLMLLSAVDYKFNLEEEKVIQDYLAEEFPLPVNLDREIETISALPPHQWRDHFEAQARDFYADSSLEERKNFLRFAKKLIKADHEITRTEEHYYRLLERLWEM